MLHNIFLLPNIDNLFTFCIFINSKINHTNIISILILSTTNPFAQKVSDTFVKILFPSEPSLPTFHLDSVALLLKDDDDSPYKALFSVKRLIRYYSSLSGIKW